MRGVFQQPHCPYYTLLYCVEVSWILEDNLIMQKAVRLLDGRQYKTYRIYSKELA